MVFTNTETIIIITFTIQIGNILHLFIFIHHIPHYVPDFILTEGSFG